MIKLIPENNTVLCVEETPARQSVVEFGIKYQKDAFPTYRVIQKSSDFTGIDIIENDIVVCNSTGTRLVDNGSVYYLFKSENIVGKLV